MASLEDIKNQLEEANKGTTPYAEIQQDNQLKILEVMNALVGKIDKLSGVVAAPPPSGDDNSGDKPTPKSKPKDLTFLEKISKTMVDIKKGAEDRFRAMTFQKKKEKRSGLGKDLESGKETGNIYNLAAEKIKNPFAMVMGKIKMLGAQVVQAVGKLLGFVSSIFSPLTALIIGVGAGIFEAYKAWVGTEGSLSDKLVAAVKGFVDGFFTGIGKALEFIVNLVPKLLKALGFEKEAKIVENLITDVKEFVVGLYNSIKEALEPLGKLFESAVKWVEDNWTEIEIVIGGIWAATKAVIAAVWDTLVMSFDGLVLLFTTVKDWFVENWDTIAEVISLIWEGLKFTVTEVYNAITGGIESIKKFFTDAKTWFTETWNTVTEVVDTVWEKVKTAVTNVFDFYKGIFTGIKTIYEGVLAFFSAGAGADDESVEKIEAMKEVFTKMKDKVMSIFTTIKDVFKKFTDMLVIPDLSEYVPDISKVLSSMGTFVSDAISKAISFIKSKIPFMGGEDSEKDTTVEDLKSSGALTKAGKFDRGDAAIDEGTLKTLTMAQIETIQAEYPDKGGYKKLHQQLRDEVESRIVIAGPSAEAPTKVGTGTMVTALNPAPSVPMASGVAPATVSSGNIVGLSHEGVAHSGQMQVAQKSLDQSRTNNYVDRSAGNTSVASVDNSSSVVNNSYYQSAMASPIDASDKASQPLIFRR